MAEGLPELTAADGSGRADRTDGADSGTPTAVAVVCVGGSRLTELSGGGVIELTELTKLMVAHTLHCCCGLCRWKWTDGGEWWRS